MVRKDLTKKQAASVRRRNKAFRTIETNRLRCVKSTDDEGIPSNGLRIVSGPSIAVSQAISHAAGQQRLDFSQVADFCAVLVTMRNDPGHRKALIEWLGEA